MSRTRILIALYAAITPMAVLTTMSSGSTTSANKLYADMDGEQERPTAGDPDGTGVATITRKSKRLCYSITVKDAGLTFAAGHIHKGVRGKAGDVFVALFESPKTVSGGKLTGCHAATARQIAAVRSKPTNYYVNLHNSTYPAGAIRGQLTKKKPS